MQGTPKDLQIVATCVPISCTSQPNTVPTTAPSAPSLSNGACPAGSVSTIVDSRTPVVAGLCLTLLGAPQPGGAGGWVVPTGVQKPLVTAPCSTSSLVNQAFVWDAPTLTHAASGYVLTVLNLPAVNGDFVGMVPPSGSLAQQQAWGWNAPGPIQFAASAGPPYFLTDALATTSSTPPTKPVHLWRLAESLPGGTPHGRWSIACVPVPPALLAIA